MDTSDRESILREIARFEEELASLRKQQEEAAETLRSLRERLSLHSKENLFRPTPPASIVASTTTNLTRDDKVALFLRLFRGRDDVYPKLWQNRKTGKNGYSPACTNEWVRGVCEKPRVKCGECPNQAFLPVSADVILNHLQGRHVIGVYPMLTDETCWLLAADFDKSCWREDVFAFSETCRRIGFSYAIERSRSGNGAHVWFFFSNPIAAATARKMGSYLITETMAQRHELSMASYDRLFPNQDTLPNGGFGNLIALPLQYHPRQEGNTVFLDDSLEPFPDQWGFLASLVLIHRQPLLEQWRSQIGIFLGQDAKSIGQIGGGKRKLTGRIDVAMIQSLSRKDSVDDIVVDYGQVIIEECHHLPAVSFERVLSEVKARYVVGLTATPQRRDGHQPIIHMQIGPVRFKADPRSQLTQRPFDHRLVIRETAFDPPSQASDITVQEIYSLLANDKQRNEQIIDDVLMAMEECRSPILLTERKEHLEHLHDRLTGFVRNIVILRGGRSAKERRKIEAQLASIPDDEERLILATGRYIGQGFDEARLDTLFLALPVSWKGTLVQYAGRLHRLHPGKHEVRIVDYVDSKLPMLARMFECICRSKPAVICRC